MHASARRIAASLAVVLGVTVTGGCEALDRLVGDPPAPQVHGPFRPADLDAPAPVPGDADVPSARGVLDRAVAARAAARIARRTEIPARAAEAYLVAAGRVQRERPGCRLGWNTLAGIGWVESQHGTLGGARLREDATTSPTIVGPALDGGRYAALRPTRQYVALHGDPTWDHAVGPMQFVATTWATWGADGDRDGSRDPRDLDDAALAAGRYLCSAGQPLTGEAWTRAVRTYNDDLYYAALVFDATVSYARATD